MEGLERRGNVPTHPKVSLPFDYGVSAPLNQLFGLRGSPALPKRKRTKGRRPCWHHDAASLQPAARRCLSSRPRSLLPLKHEFYFQVVSRAAGWAGLGPRLGPPGRSILRWLMAAGSPSFLPPSCFAGVSLGAGRKPRVLRACMARHPESW